MTGRQCAGCGARISHNSVYGRCRACAGKAKSKPELHTCSICKGRKTKAAAMCLGCQREAERQRYACLDCGQRKSNAKSVRCRPCKDIRLRKGIGYQVDGILVGFDADAFAREMERSGWTPGLLEEWTTRQGQGVSAFTIRRWMLGGQRPLASSFVPVARVLAMTSCTHCDGLGVVPGDRPTEFKRRRMTDWERRQNARENTRAWRERQKEQSA